MLFNGYYKIKLCYYQCIFLLGISTTNQTFSITTIMHVWTLFPSDREVNHFETLNMSVSCSLEPDPRERWPSGPHMLPVYGNAAPSVRVHQNGSRLRSHAAKAVQNR
uniref:(northern house mosquito) hypothetical protein n=1 Tax=Culex pipiens TaxID=7175 RepID=A0A8D8CRR4_CULPI